MPTLEDIKHDDFATDVRTHFTEFSMYWEENFKQGDLDIRALSLDGPWDTDERERRSSEGRLCEHHDIISQYNRRINNQARLNARGIKIDPAGEKATPETAGKREDRIRQIEYESNAKYARENALENAVDRGMGFYIVRTDYVSPESFDQKIIVDAILNPKSVLLWPYCKQPDKSDQLISIVIERYAHSVFRQKWPRAEFKSFGADMINLFPQWISNKDVQVCSYWKVETKERHRLRIQGPGGKTMDLYADEVPDAKVQGTKAKGYTLKFPNGNAATILKEKYAQFPTVKQYMTNGIEKLDTKDWIGTSIPIIAVFGKEKYGEDGRLIVESATRKARSAQLAYDFGWTNQLEGVGQIPKAKIGLAEGQQETQTDWENLNRTATAFFTYKRFVNGVDNGQPMVINWTPDVESAEIVKQSAMTAIENAYGISSIQHQDKVAKSGKALDSLTSQADVTNYHFQDASDRGLSFEYRVINEILDKVEDTETVRGFRTADGEYSTDKVTPKQDPSTGEIVDHPYGEAGAHDVTVSIQKHYSSQFEKYTDFLDTVAADPKYGPILMPLIIKARELGPLGDKMYEIAVAMAPAQVQKILNGDDQGANAAQLQQQAEQLNQMLQASTDQIHQLKDQIAAKQVEIDAKVQMNRENNDTKIIVADISAKVDHQAEIVGMFAQKMDGVLELIKQQREHAHAAGLQDQSLAHASDQGEQQAQLTREQMQQTQEQPQ